MAVIGTTVVRAWMIDKVLTQKKEIVFWTAGIIGGTMILVIINSGFVSPLVKNFTVPSLSVDVMRLSLSDENPMNHQVTYLLSIYNAGAPTVIRNWRLKVSGPDREDIYPPIAILAGYETSTNVSPSGEQFTYNRKNSFVEDAGNNPIVRGGKQTGYIVFVINDTARAYLESHETKYELSLWDITGKEYKCPAMSLPAPKRK